MKKTLVLLLLLYVVAFGQRSYTNYGDTIHPSATTSTYATNFIYYFKITVDAIARLDSASVYIALNSPSNHVRFALYEDNAGAPGAIVDSTEEVSMTGGLLSAPFTNLKTIEAGVYHIAINRSVNSLQAKGAGGSSNWRFQSSAYSAGWPATATGGGTGAFSDTDAYITVSVAVDAKRQNKYIGWGGYNKY